MENIPVLEEEQEEARIRDHLTVAFLFVWCLVIIVVNPNNLSYNNYRAAIKGWMKSMQLYVHCKINMLYIQGKAIW